MGERLCTALCIALSTFATWVVANAGTGESAVTAQLNGMMFQTGRLTLGVALLVVLAIFVAKTRQMRGYTTFVGGVFLLALGWYFAMDIYELSESMTTRPDPVLGAVTTSPGAGVYVTVGLALVMMAVGWRAVGDQIADQLPGMRRGAKLRNILLVGVSILLLMEGVNVALGVGTPALEVTTEGSSGDGAGVPTASPTASPTATPTGTENPYEVNDAPEFEIGDDDDVSGGVYVGGGSSGGACGADDIDGDGDGICNEG